MLSSITFYPILGIPLIAWGGLVTFILLITTAMVAILTVKNIYPLPVKLHVNLARITVALAAIHGVLGFLSYII